MSYRGNYRGDIVYATRTHTGPTFKEPGRRNPLTCTVTAQRKEVA